MTDNPGTLPRYVPHAKAERLVATTRLLIAAYSVVASVLTGMLGEPRGAAAVSLLTAWFMLAVTVWIRTRSGRQTSVAIGAIIPILDLLIIASVIMNSGGAVSPFFPLLVLPFFAVSVLYGRRVIAWTGLVGISAYLLVSFATPYRATNPRLFVMRIGFLLIIGTSVLQRNEFDVRTRSDALKLATWPQPAGLERDDFLRTLLAHAADILRTPRVLLAWEDVERGQLALWKGGAMELLDPPADGSRSMVSLALADASFLTRDAAATNPDGLRFDGRRFSGHRGPLLASDLVQRFAVRAVVSVCFKAEIVEGRIFFLDGVDVDSDDLTLAEIVARLLSSALEQTSLLESLQRTTATEERMRLSRDLHDTLLQSMAGLALHTEGARREIATNPAGAEQRLEVVVDQLSEAQRSLRAFVDDLRPESPPHREPLRPRLGRIASGIARRWGLSVSIHSEERWQLSEALTAEVCNLVTESLTNAARHAAATHVVARVTSTEEEVRLEIEDDGHGFPFQGRYELADLVARQLGPWSLKERVSALHGAMMLDSSKEGSRIEIRLPLSS